MNNEIHRGERAAWERGYREALLDVFCFLIGNETVLDTDPTHLVLLQGMANAVARAGDKAEQLSS